MTYRSTLLHFRLMEQRLFQHVVTIDQARSKSAAPTGRARCRRCRRRIEKGATRVEICAFVRPGRRTLLLRCADCVDARFAAAVLAVHGRAERVPVEAALVGSAEAQRVQRAIDAASGGGGEHEEKSVCVLGFR